MSRVAPIDKLSVVITICLSFLFLKEPVSLRVVAGVRDCVKNVYGTGYKWIEL